jgi:hypothetical protein
MRGRLRRQWYNASERTSAPSGLGEDVRGTRQSIRHGDYLRVARQPEAIAITSYKSDHWTSGFWPLDKRLLAVPNTHVCPARGFAPGWRELVARRGTPRLGFRAWVLRSTLPLTPRDPSKIDQFRPGVQLLTTPVANWSLTSGYQYARLSQIVIRTIATRLGASCAPSTNAPQT